VVQLLLSFSEKSSISLELRFPIHGRPEAVILPVGQIRNLGSLRCVLLI